MACGGITEELLLSCQGTMVQISEIPALVFVLQSDENRPVTNRAPNQWTYLSVLKTVLSSKIVTHFMRKGLPSGSLRIPRKPSGAALFAEGAYPGYANGTTFEAIVEYMPQGVGLWERPISELFQLF